MCSLLRVCMNTSDTRLAAKVIDKFSEAEKNRNSNTVINCKCDDCATLPLLCRSILHNKLKFAKFLIENGACIIQTDNNHLNSFFYAAKYGSEKFITFLLTSKYLYNYEKDVLVCDAVCFQTIKLTPQLQKLCNRYNFDWNYLRKLRRFYNIIRECRENAIDNSRSNIANRSDNFFRVISTIFDLLRTIYFTVTSVDIMECRHNIVHESFWLVIIETMKRNCSKVDKRSFAKLSKILKEFPDQYPFEIFGRAIEFMFTMLGQSELIVDRDVVRRDTAILLLRLVYLFYDDHLESITKLIQIALKIDKTIFHEVCAVIKIDYKILVYLDDIIILFKQCGGDIGILDKQGQSLHDIVRKRYDYPVLKHHFQCSLCLKSIFNEGIPSLKCLSAQKAFKHKYLLPNSLRNFTSYHQYQQ